MLSSSWIARYRPVAHRALVATLIGWLATTLAGCSTLPFAPRQGAGTALTLATVSDVADRDAELEQRVEELVEARLEEAIAAAHADDDARIAALEQRAEAQARALTALDEQSAEAGDQRAELATLLAEALDGLATGTEEMRRVTMRLDQEIGRLPAETLLQLGEAIEQHLLRRAAAEAGLFDGRDASSEVEPAARRAVTRRPVAATAEARPVR